MKISDIKVSFSRKKTSPLFEPINNGGAVLNYFYLLVGRSETVEFLFIKLKWNLSFSLQRSKEFTT